MRTSRGRSSAGTPRDRRPRPLTAQVASPAADPGSDPIVDDLVRVAAGFPDLGYLAPDGVLDLPLDLGRIRGIRIEGKGGQAIRLQSIGIDADGMDDLAAVASVQVSSRAGDLDGPPDPASLFAFDRPTGTLIETKADDPAWVEIRFTEPLTVRRLRLRNAADATAKGARGLRVAIRTRWRTRVVYDIAKRTRDWRRSLTTAKTGAAGDVDALGLFDVLDMTVRGDYGRAHRSLVSRVSDERRRIRFRAAVNEELLPRRGLEWTVHGPQRPFRSWTEDERVDYVRDSSGVVDALRSLTPDVCLGFGSVLSVVRDKALIPHDDDLDIIIGFDPAVAATLADALRLIEAHLVPFGYQVTGGFAAHRHVRRPGRKKVDVFVGIFEGEAISWYPGARGGLTRAIVFPPGPAELLGVPCLIPAQAEVYLERLYGEGWRVPDPYFSHAWNLSAYADITGAAPPTPTSPPTDAPRAQTSASGTDAP